MTRHLQSLSLLAAALSLAGCASFTPEALAPEAIQAQAVADIGLHRKDIVPISGAVTLDEAIARALKYNLEHRSKSFELALASGQLEAGQFDMLPKLLANAGYFSRDSDQVRRSQDVNGNTYDNRYVSSERKHATQDLTLSWSMLDFGASYFNAKQNADRVLIATERRRKSMHMLIQNVRTTYWRALAAQYLGKRVSQAIDDAELALKDSRGMQAAKVRSPAESLRFQRTLLDNLRQLEALQRELATARVELASLIGAAPGTALVLSEPADEAPTALSLSLETMESQALLRNADLREAAYNVRIATNDTRKAILKLMPGISFDYGSRRDNDRFLVDQQWQEASVRVSLNLFNLLSAPSQKKAAETAEAVMKTRQMALQMALLTQVHLSMHQYDDALRQYQRAHAIADVDSQLSEISSGQEQSQMAGRLDRISANVVSILSVARRYQSMARVQEALSRVQATLGLEPEVDSLDSQDLPSLQKTMQRSLKNWTEQMQVRPKPQAMSPFKPNTAVQS
jgi:outer membrane protein TolC